MITLLLIRHGIAESSSISGSDRNRQLTRTGRDQFQMMADWLVENDAKPEKILSSPLLRAQQTAEILSESAELNFGEDQVCPWIGFGLQFDKLLSCLNESFQSTIAIVGHEPDMSSCTSRLVGGGSYRFTPGTVACIRFEDNIRDPFGTLKWVKNPEKMTA
jgi:phosphohistidine phosphatase